VTFRVVDGGRSFALRVGRPGYQTLAAIRSELAWMDALRASGIRTPPPVHGRDGEVVQQFEFGGRRQVAVAYDWVAGVPLAETESTAPWARLGGIMASIHHHGRMWRQPDWFDRPAWDLEALVGESPRWGNPLPSGAWSDETRRLLARARAVVRDRLTALGTGPDRFGLVHSDLGFENVLIDGSGDAIVIDFDDCGASWYLYEIASVLYPLEGDERFSACRDALVAGYRRSGDLPDALLAELPTFLMARRLATLGWIFSRPDTDHAKRQRPKRLRTSPGAARRFLDWSAGHPVAA
jgi:Ser/Thr protein kinase RdoA (MazF antagonist)